MKRSLILCLLTLMVTLAQAAPRLVAEQKAVPGALSIPYQLYRLDNGLTLILSPDHSDPLVHVDVTYHVGSSREHPQQTGFAHFFEHMMFQGSKHVGDQQHFKLIEEAGGTLNGSTNKDRTNYYNTVPANQLEKVLWLEADRMGFLLEAVSQRKFEIQRDTVKNERAERYENQPYGLLMERAGEALYPRTHPYSWQPIGYVEDLNRVGVEDLRQFFLRWYGPNNATLTLGGDFDVAQALTWVEKYFGGIPRGPEVEDPRPQPGYLPRSRDLILEDKVHLPLFYQALPTVYLGHADEPALDVLADILGGSESAMLQQALVDTGLAVDVGTGHYCEELACSLSIWAYANPARVDSLRPIAEAVQQVLADFARRGVQADDLARIKGKLRASAVWQLESVAGKVSQLAEGQVLMNDPQYSLRAIEATAAVQPESVMRVYRQYVQDKPRVRLSVVPEGQPQWGTVKATEAYSIPARQLPPLQADQPIPLRRVDDGLDRSKPPAAGPAVTAAVPALWQASMAPGIQILGTLNDEIPAVSLIIALPGGLRAETPETLGLAKLTAELMNQGTERLGYQAFSDELQRLGASIRVSQAQYNSLIEVKSLKENLPQTLKLVEELLYHPGLRAEDFARVRGQLLQGMQQQQREPDWLADQGFRQLIYGSDSRLGKPVEGYLEQTAKLSLAQVKAFHQRFYNPANARVVAVGDVTSDALLPQLAFLGRWSGTPPALAPLRAGATPPAPGIYLLDQPGAVQSAIRIGRRALPYDATGDHFQASLMNFNLGGNFNSRINQNLREAKGYTYGAYSAFVGYRDAGAFQINTSVRAETTADAVRQILKEMDGVRQGVRPDELAFLQRSVLQQDALAYESLEQKANFLLQLLMRELQPDYVAQQHRLVRELSLEQLKQTAHRWLDGAGMVIVIVGDRARLEKSLAGLHLPIHALTLNGAAVTPAPAGEAATAAPHKDDDER